MQRNRPCAVRFAAVRDVWVPAVDDSETIPEAGDDSRRSMPVLRNYRLQG
jgi:hypothetical protein